MNTFEQRVSLIKSEPFIAAVPVTARPPNGHVIWTELATIMSTSISEAMLGRVAVAALELSHYELASEKEAIDLDDFARLLRQRSAFAIDKKCPAADLTKTASGGYLVTPLVRSGLGKTWDELNATEVSESTNFAAVGAAIRSALNVSSASITNA